MEDERMKAFLGTALGKVVVAVLAVAVVAGGGYGIYRAVQSDPVPAAAITDPAEETTTTEAPKTTEAETTTEEEITEAPTEAPTAAPTTTQATTTSTTKATTTQQAQKANIVLTGVDWQGKTQTVTFKHNGVDRWVYSGERLWLGTFDAPEYEYSDQNPERPFQIPEGRWLWFRNDDGQIECVGNGAAPGQMNNYFGGGHIRIIQKGAVICDASGWDSVSKSF